MRMIPILALAPCLLLAASCSQAPLQGLPVEVLVAAPLALDIETQGQVRAVRSTPLITSSSTPTAAASSPALPMTRKTARSK